MDSWFKSSSFFFQYFGTSATVTGSKNVIYAEIVGIV